MKKYKNIKTGYKEYLIVKNGEIKTFPLIKNVRKNAFS